MLRRCLQRDRDRRLHDMADARIEVEETLSGSATAESRAIAGVNGWQPADTAAVVALIVASAVNVLFLYRLVPSLASTYAGAGLELSAPLRFYMAGANNAMRVLPLAAAVLVAFWFVRRPRITAVARSGVLAMLATIACVETMAGLYFVAENGLVHSMRLEFVSGASAQVLQRDLAALYVVASEPQKAVELLDPQRTLDKTFTAAQAVAQQRLDQLSAAPAR